jgi:7,8-dihydropterin-6-yl-methyl-4-(beta-D-ribofuranosyl)aminobenzene 5'-phosphate synthase
VRCFFIVRSKIVRVIVIINEGVPSVEIVTLIENTSRDPSLVAAHGLSLHIEAQGHCLLFDMGPSDAFLSNAGRLGVDVGGVDAAVVSHAHYDHGGGLAPFLAANRKAPVYLKVGADADYYGNIGSKLSPRLLGVIHPLVRYSPRFSRYIGLDKMVLQRHAERFKFVADHTLVYDNISLVTAFNCELPRPEGNKFLLQKTGDRLVPDSFAHELMLVIQEPDGLVLFTGCGHNGILNMLAAAKRLFADQPIKAVLGGFHLALQPGRPGIAGKPADIESVADALLQAGVDAVYTGHCTGEEAYGILKGVMGDRLGRLHTGARITI